MNLEFGSHVTVCKSERHDDDGERDVESDGSGKKDGEKARLNCE